MPLYDVKGTIMDEQNNSFQSPVQPQRPLSDSVVQPQRPLSDSVIQPQQPFGAQPEQPQADPGFFQQPAPDPYAQQPFSGAEYQPQQPFGGAEYQPQQPYANPAYQQPFGAPTAPPPGYVPGAQPVYGSTGSYQPPAGTGKATAALACGIAAIVVCIFLPFVGAPIGIILGIVAIVLAGSFIKQNGPFGRAKAGRVCGIIGLILSILSLITLIAAVSFAAVVGSNLYDDFAISEAIDITDALENDLGLDFDLSLPNDYEDLDSAIPFAERVLSADEQAAIDVVSAEFDALIADDEGIIARVGLIAEEGFYEVTGLTFKECGVDSTEYALVITEGLTYEMDDIELYDDGDGFVGVSVSCKDIYQIYEEFYEELSALASTPGAEGMSDAEYNQKAGQILMDTIRNAEVVTACNWAIIDVENEGGAWTIDKDSWDFEMEYMFSLA